MSSYNFDFEENDLQEMFSRMGESLQAETKGTLEKIGKAVKGNVEASIGYSDHHDPSRPHIKDDVKTTVKTYAAAGGYVKVQGSKKTRTLWHLANDGHVAENGRFVQGNHFVDKAAALSENTIESAVDSLLKGAVESG